MCELLGMNCNVPTDILFSFRGFRQRGGRTGPHSDGWGMAFYQGRGCQMFHDPSPSAESPMAQFLQGFPIRSKNVVAHIRRARTGRVSVENTHPFYRELWGRTWVFAHNGQLSGVKRLPVGQFQPIGTTDSEHAFCLLLDRIRREFPGPPSVAKLRGLVEKVGNELGELGEFNFLLCDSRALFAHCSRKLVYIERAAPFSRAVLCDDDLEVDFRELTKANDRVVVVATRPLTNNETWTTIPPGSTVAFVAGRRA